MTRTLSDKEPDQQEVLVQAYCDAAIAYVRTGQEDALSRAYDIARAALQCDMSIVKLCSIHGDVVRNLPASGSNDQLQGRLEQFFLETVSVYDMAQNGYRDAVARMNHEIVERKKIEEELRDATFELVRQRDDLDQQVKKRTQEIQQTLDELNVVNTRLQQANDEQAEFTYALSHDLKSPLNTIAMMLDILGTDLPDLGEEPRRVLDAACETAHRMLGMIDDVLHYSKTIEEPRKNDPVDLNALVEGIIDDLQSDIQASGAVVKYGGLPTIAGDAMQFRILFQNFVSNSIKFRSSERRPEVRIEHATDAAGGHCFRVSDNGIGIDPRYHDRIFGLFQRLHVRDEYPGTGLGLTLCKRIVGNHSGKIFVESEPGQGSTFTVVFKG